MKRIDARCRYQVVLADPPWSYHGQQDKWGAAAKFYPTMTDTEVAEFPIHHYLAPVGVVFMWATCPRLDFAIHVLTASWGLHFRGVAFVWVKTKIDGTPIKGQGVRPSITKPLTELVIAGSTVAKGRPLPLSDESICQTVFAPKQEHSRKPDAVQERIEQMYPTARKCELFARRKRPGWDGYGDEV